MRLWPGQLTREKSAHPPKPRTALSAEGVEGRETYPYYRSTACDVLEDLPMMNTNRLSNLTVQPQTVAEPYRVPMSEGIGLVVIILVILASPFLFDLSLAVGLAR